MQLFPETVRLLRALVPLRVEPTMPVFTHTRGGPIEPNSLLSHWYAAQRACGIRVRGHYSTKDTFVTTALKAGVTIAWLETQTGVNYLTLRRHYGAGCQAMPAANSTASPRSIRGFSPPRRPRLLPVTSLTGHNGEKA